MKKSNNTSKIVGALLLGATVGGIVGAALGILFAPEKGKEMRKKLLAKSGDFSDNINNKITDLVQEVKSEADSVKGKLTEVFGKGVNKIAELK